MRPKMKKMILFAPLAILGILVFAFIGGEVVKLLWNWLVPPLFGWREISFWQAFGLLALCRILFGGHGFGGSNVRNRMGERMGEGMRQRMADRMADRIGDRWDGMTPEERERFRQRIRERCGFDPSTSQTQGGNSL